MKQEDFKFTKEELILLANAQYTALRIEAANTDSSSLSKLFNNQDTVNAKRLELISLKNSWINNWQKATWKLLSIESSPYEKDLLISNLQEFKKNSTQEKVVIFALECASFYAYYPFNEGDRQLEFDENIYLNNLNLKIPNNGTANLRKYYNQYFKQVSDELKTEFQKYFKYIAGIAGIAILAIIAPFIVAGIGGLMGLSGAAASSAGLALLGGGSIAAGGFGMAGGTFFLLGGGALAGFVSGKAISEKDLDSLKSENLVVSSAKLLAATKLLAENKKINFKDVYSFLSSLRHMQFKFEENIDKSVCLTKKLDNQKYDDYKKNSVILSYTRKKMLELLVDNKD